MIKLLLASALAALSPVERQELVEGYATQRLCSEYVSEAAKAYLRELVILAARNDPSITQFFYGVDSAVMEELIKYKYTQQYCVKELPKAFEQTELFKKIAKPAN